MALTDYERDLAKQLIAYQRKTKKLTEDDHKLSYEDWYLKRAIISHQMRTRGDEYWFAQQVGANIKGSGKRHYELFDRKVDLS